MEQLELKFLAPYIAYDLQMLMQWPNNPHQIGTLKTVGLHPYKGDGEKLTVFVEFEKNDARQIIYHKTSKNPIFKPLLLPLSEITVEIMKQIYAEVNAPAHMPDYCDCDTIGFNGKEFTHTFEGDISYDGGYEFERTTQILENQYELLQGLFKRHFDYFGLLGGGLALDKRDYEK